MIVSPVEKAIYWMNRFLAEPDSAASYFYTIKTHVWNSLYYDDKAVFDFTQQERFRIEDGLYGFKADGYTYVYREPIPEKEQYQLFAIYDGDVCVFWHEGFSSRHKFSLNARCIEAFLIWFSAIQAHRKIPYEPFRI